MDEKNKKFNDMMERFYDLNNMLEMCRGYAQCDLPSVEAIAEVLYMLHNGYMEVYTSFLAIDEVK